MRTMAETTSCFSVFILPSFPSNKLCGWAHSGPADVSLPPSQLGVAMELKVVSIVYTVKEKDMLGLSSFLSNEIKT